MSRLTLCTLFLLGLGGCAARDAEFADYRFVAMATTIELRLPIGTTDAYPDLLGEIETELQAFGRDYYAWGDGELHRLNLALSASGSFDASPAMAALLGRARDIAVATDGAFDPGVGGLVELWGFNDAGGPGAHGQRHRGRAESRWIDREHRHCRQSPLGQRRRVHA
jgi:thiamine biosynthesis lipoprotein